MSPSGVRLRERSRALYAFHQPCSDYVLHSVVDHRRTIADHPFYRNSRTKLPFVANFVHFSFFASNFRHFSDVSRSTATSASNFYYSTQTRTHNGTVVGSGCNGCILRKWQFKQISVNRFAKPKQQKKCHDECGRGEIVRCTRSRRIYRTFALEMERSVHSARAHIRESKIGLAAARRLCDGTVTHSSWLSSMHIWRVNYVIVKRARKIKSHCM